MLHGSRRANTPGSEGIESTLALSMYSSATNNNNNNEMIPEAFRDIYLVAMNNEEEVEFDGLDEMFYAVFENDGSETQRNEINETKNSNKIK